MKKSSPKKEKIEVIIDRSKWKTGICGLGATRLLNKEGFMCCLGFISKAVLRKRKKNSTKSIKNKSTPACVNVSIPDLNMPSNNDLNKDIMINSPLSINAMCINDNLDPIDIKEKELKKLFKNSIYKLKFIGKPVYES